MIIVINFKFTQNLKFSIFHYHMIFINYVIQFQVNLCYHLYFLIILLFNSISNLINQYPIISILIIQLIFQYLIIILKFYFLIIYSFLLIIFFHQLLVLILSILISIHSIHLFLNPTIILILQYHLNEFIISFLILLTKVLDFLVY